ncbi:MAG: PAS domain S-box protein [Gammaproteobacteria bacterium]|nr:PAS domain S-box protein [Gammaproteobacteria bacterium]
MSIPTDQPGSYEKMRREAERHLREGTANSTHGGALSPDALSLLHRLASDPASAGDALKLLHELQVHQVELDLQHRQIETNEQQMGEELARYKALFEFAPIAYLVLSLDGDVMEANAEAASLLDVARNEIAGRRITELVPQGNQLALAGLMKRLKAGSARAHCQIHLKDAGDAVPALQLSASISPGGAALLVVLSGQDRR